MHSPQSAVGLWGGGGRMSFVRASGELAASTILLSLKDESCTGEFYGMDVHCLGAGGSAVVVVIADGR